MNGIDWNDRDSRDYSTSIHTNRWYIRIFCFALDRVVHALHTIMTFLAQQGIRKPEWKKYRDKIQGHHDFQIDLGISLLNYGIGLDWDGVSDEQPSYMQTGAFKPCECKKCFFYLKSHTSGITHHPQKQPTNKCTHDWRLLSKAGNY